MEWYIYGWIVQSRLQMGFAAYDVLRSGVEHDDLQAVGSTTWFIVVILDADLLEPSLAVPRL